jgi:DNA-binding NarL/FixJ family response regulator
MSKPNAPTDSDPVTGDQGTVVALALRDKALAATLTERFAAAGTTVLECPSLERLVPWFKEIRADVLLLEERWFRQGADSVPSLRPRPEQRVLLVGERASKALAEQVIRQRFQGFIVAGEAADVCVKAVRAVKLGETWIPRGLLVELLLEHVRPAHARQLEIVGSKLTPRETQVIVYVRRGLTNKQIAESLAVTEGTVKGHLRSAFTKLGVHRRSEIMTESLVIG